jgi:DNA-binding phage protein
MALDLERFDALDWIDDDEDLAFLLDDALSAGEGDVLNRVIALIERAKNLPATGEEGSIERLLRAADAVGRRVLAIPRIDQDQQAA